MGFAAVTARAAGTAVQYRRWTAQQRSHRAAAATVPGAREIAAAAAVRKCNGKGLPLYRGSPELVKKGVSFSKLTPTPTPPPKGEGLYCEGTAYPQTRQRTLSFEPNKVFRQTDIAAYCGDVILILSHRHIHPEQSMTVAVSIQDPPSLLQQTAGTALLRVQLDKLCPVRMDHAEK